MCAISKVRGEFLYERLDEVFHKLRNSLRWAPISGDHWAAGRGDDIFVDFGKEVEVWGAW